MKLLCDEMLGGLARWLRAAGHDTALAQAQARDAQLIEQALAEDRVLVSRDRRLVQEAGRRAQAVLLVGDHLEEQALQLGEALSLDWTLAPFTRCMVDNTPLRPATEEERARIPPGPRSLPGPERACPSCGRLFWPGSHVRSMLARLEAWRASSQTPAGP